MPRPKDPSLAGKTDRIDTRVSPATREALEQAAAARGWSLSREIEDRLEESLAKDGADGLGAQPLTQSLLWALRLVVEEVEGVTGRHWWEDGFTRDAVADAVRWLVLFAGPNVDSGSSDPPPSFPTFMDYTSYEPARRAAADELIKVGLGRRYAEIIIRRMATPLPKSELGSFAERAWAQERTAAQRLRPFLRVSSNEGGEGR